ncbi:hypothetical protein WJX72_010876 [[Myrmecia] bisecta]|uniref:tRNA(His) guanylyltransferase n=1 Tax=[Myrmecia] bisecta TaxID=41462 RepID=A0AAW1QGE6_9CHLO
MAKSRFEYVKSFEQDDSLLPQCWIVVRIDGKGFTKFTSAHKFEKPNDVRALQLMDACAKEVMREFGDIRIAYGESDEYSFIFHKSTHMYGRRSSKLVALTVSCFTGNYVRLWPQYLPNVTLQCTPTFDGRAVCYPTVEILRDYLSWRQADTHINNQYNTCFWALVKSGKTTTEAQALLKDTQTRDKNELLFSQFNINYTEVPEQFRKGSIVVRQRQRVVVKHGEDGTPVEREVSVPTVLHVDIIGNQFWVDNPQILS